MDTQDDNFVPFESPFQRIVKGKMSALPAADGFAPSLPEPKTFASISTDLCQYPSGARELAAIESVLESLGFGCDVRDSPVVRADESVAYRINVWSINLHGNAPVMGHTGDKPNPVKWVVLPWFTNGRHSAIAGAP